MNIKFYKVLKTLLFQDKQLFLLSNIRNFEITRFFCIVFELFLENLNVFVKF